MKTEDIQKVVLQRLDTYISGVNTKGSFIVAFNTFLCAGAIANYKNLVELAGTENIDCLNVLLLLLFILSILSTLFVGFAVFPYLKSGNSSIEKYHSVIFFNSIAEFKSSKEYASEIENKTEKEYSEDISNQIFQIAKGLKRKFLWIGIAMICLFLQLGLLLGIITTIIY